MKCFDVLAFGFLTLGHTSEADATNIGDRVAAGLGLSSSTRESTTGRPSTRVAVAANSSSSNPPKNSRSATGRSNYSYTGVSNVSHSSSAGSGSSWVTAPHVTSITLSNQTRRGQHRTTIDGATCDVWTTPAPCHGSNAMTYGPNCWDNWNSYWKQRSNTSAGCSDLILSACTYIGATTMTVTHLLGMKTHGPTATLTNTYTTTASDGAFAQTTYVTVSDVTGLGYYDSPTATSVTTRTDSWSQYPVTYTSSIPVLTAPNCTLPSLVPQCQSSWVSYLDPAQLMATTHSPFPQPTCSRSSTNVSRIQACNDSWISYSSMESSLAGKWWNAVAEDLSVRYNGYTPTTSFGPMCIQASIGGALCDAMHDRLSSAVGAGSVSVWDPVVTNVRDAEQTYSQVTKSLVWPSNYTLAPGCTVGCSACHITGGMVQLLYWPPATTFSNGSFTIRPTLPVTASYDGTVLTSPTNYISFHKIFASDSCSAIGQTYSNTIIALNPSVVLSSLYGYDDTNTNRLYTASFNYADLAQPVPNSIYNSQPRCAESSYWWANPYTPMADTTTANSTPATFVCPRPVPYKPIISLPVEIRNIDPSWSVCFGALEGIYDPPVALQPASVVAVPSQPAAPTSTPASPASVAQPTTPTATAQSTTTLASPASVVQPSTPTAVANPTGQLSGSEQSISASGEISTDQYSAIPVSSAVLSSETVESGGLVPSSTGASQSSVFTSTVSDPSSNAGVFTSSGPDSSSESGLVSSMSDPTAAVLSILSAAQSLPAASPGDSGTTAPQDVTTGMGSSSSSSVPTASEVASDASTGVATGEGGTTEAIDPAVSSHAPSSEDPAGIIASLLDPTASSVSSAASQQDPQTYSSGQDPTLMASSATMVESDANPGSTETAHVVLGASSITEVSDGNTFLVNPTVTPTPTALGDPADPNNSDAIHTIVLGSVTVTTREPDGSPVTIVSVSSGYQLLDPNGATATLLVSAPATTINGEVLSAASDGLVVAPDSILQPLYSTALTDPSDSSLVLGTQTFIYTSLPGSAYVFAGPRSTFTVSLGRPATSGESWIVSPASSGQFVVYTNGAGPTAAVSSVASPTVGVSNVAYPTASASTQGSGSDLVVGTRTYSSIVTIGGAEVYAGNGLTFTVSPGGSGTTIEGYTISAASSGEIVIAPTQLQATRTKNRGTTPDPGSHTGSTQVTQGPLSASSVTAATQKTATSAGSACLVLQVHKYTVLAALLVGGACW